MRGHEDVFDVFCLGRRVLRSRLAPSEQPLFLSSGETNLDLCRALDGLFEGTGHGAREVLDGDVGEDKRWTQRREIGGRGRTGPAKTAMMMPRANTGVRGERRRGRRKSCGAEQAVKLVESSSAVVSFGSPAHNSTRTQQQNVRDPHPRPGGGEGRGRYLLGGGGGGISQCGRSKQDMERPSLPSHWGSVGGWKLVRQALWWAL